MLYFRLIYLVKAFLNMSFYTDPRSQRVCIIYGKDADYSFAIKCIMKNDSWIVLSVTLIVTLLSMSYQVRIFERHVTPAYEYVTTSMWVFMITMLTIGYGDAFPKSHMGRMMGIVASGWGVFYVSLFVIALTNMLEFNSSELKAFNLLQRLNYKDELRNEAAGALVATYKLKLVRKQPIIDKKKETQ
jgi:voltage-gated potassium channel Kch